MKVSNETQSHAADATRGRTATNRAKQGLRVTTADGTDIYPTHDIRVGSAVDLGQNVTLIGTVPSGAAGGDLEGTFPSPTVVAINGVVISGTPSAGQEIIATSATDASWQTPASSAQWFNVRDYGAIGDGTTDDRAACQAAADAAAVGGGVLYFPPGSYKIATPGLVLDPDVAMLGDGRENTFILAGTNSINVVTITGTVADSTYEIAHASTISGIEFGANGKTGCEGVAYIGVAYWAVNRCTFRGFTVGLDVYGSLQGRVDDCKFLSNTRGIKYTAQTIGYYGGTLPPARVSVTWSTFYYNTTHAIDWSGGQQLFVSDCEFGDNGTVANAATAAIKARMGGDAGGFGLVGKNLWMELNHGLAALDLGGTVVGEHSLIDCWFAYGNSTYSIALDGSTAAQTLTAYNVRHDQVVSPATVSTFRSVGGTTHLDARWSNGSTSGTWTSIRQEPLLTGQLVADYSQWLALRLPNVTTTQRDAISSPTAGMLVWNTTTTAVNQYTGSAWAAATVSALDDLSDVTITSPVTANRLRYNGSAWVNSALIWRPLTVYDPTSALWVPLVDGSGNAIMAEA